jgi:sulfatase modifying factor 1
MTPGNKLPSPTQNYLTDVGAFTGSASHYGTFDQAGGVSEWNDDINGTGRNFTGGDWIGNDQQSPLFSTNYGGTFPSDGYHYTLGVRLVAIPEPATATLAVLGLLGVFLRRRKG